MKTLLKLSVFASIIILIAVSCKKLLSEENPVYASGSKEFNAAFVKEWYYGEFIKSAEFANFNQKKNGIKLPDWKNGKSFNIGEIQIVEFPLQASKKSIGIPNSEDKNNAAKIVAAAIQKIIFVRNKNNSITIKVMQYVPTFDFLKSQNFDISNLSIKDYTKNFKGTVRIFNWSGKFENGYLFNNDRKYKLKEGIKLSDKKYKETANKDCGGTLETWFEYDCNPDYSGDVYDENQCRITFIVDQTYTPFECGPDEENCNEAHCMCANYGVGCDFAGFSPTSDSEENSCGKITNEEGRQQLNSLVGEELFDVNYSVGSEVGPDAYGAIRLPKLSSWSFFSLDFGAGYKPNWTAQYSGIVYKNNPNDLWKWESIQYVTTIRNGPIPPCFSANMQATVSNPIISSDEMIATTAASWAVTVTIPCLASVEVDVKTGSNPSCELRSN